MIIRVFRLLRREIFIPINNFLTIISFFLRKFFLGPQNAILYISRVSKDSVIILLKLNGASIGENCDIESGLVFHNCNSFHNLVIGKNCHIGKNCFFDLRNKIYIGDNVIVSMQTTFITHIDMNKSCLSKTYKSKSGSIIINNDSYLGARSTVLMGVVIGGKALIAANSLVNKDVASSVTVAGVPAKKIKDII